MEELEYNEDEAVKFILDHLPADIKKNVKEEDIEYILDVIYDFYDEKGYLDEENDETVDILENEMLEYILNQAVRDKRSGQFTETVVSAILDSEYEYSQSIGVFDEDEDEDEDE